MDFARLTVAAGAFALLPFVAQAQGVNTNRQGVNTNISAVQVACGPGGGAQACAAVIAALPPADPLRAIARQLAVISGINPNVLAALAENSSVRGVPGTSAEDDDETASGESASPA